MNTSYYNDFLFSSRYRVWRHIIFWTLTTLVFGLFWTVTIYSFGRNVFHMLLWLPVFLLYTYPLLYLVVPKFLLKGKYLQFAFIILMWGIVGLVINYLFRGYIFIPIQEALQLSVIVKSWSQPGSLLVMTTIAAGATMIKLFYYFAGKQEELIRSEKEKVSAELQLLRAQIHPHFLFNTLNNIYSFALERSPKTPGLILKLSALLSYILYECQAELVSLEKELAVMKDYTDLELERYGNRIDISWSIEGDLREKYIAPLLLLPFLENAFKHGTSDQLDKCWLSVDIAVEQNFMTCKIANSKNENTIVNGQGIGLQNVMRRLSLMYHGDHELKTHDEGVFYVVSMKIKLKLQPVPGYTVLKTQTS